MGKFYVGDMVKYTGPRAEGKKGDVTGHVVGTAGATLISGEVVPDGFIAVRLLDRGTVATQHEDHWQLISASPFFNIKDIFGG